MKYPSHLEGGGRVFHRQGEAGKGQHHFKVRSDLSDRKTKSVDGTSGCLTLFTRSFRNRLTRRHIVPGVGGGGSAPLHISPRPGHTVLIQQQL